MDQAKRNAQYATRTPHQQMAGPAAAPWSSNTTLISDSVPYQYLPVRTKRDSKKYISPNDTDSSKFLFYFRFHDPVSIQSHPHSNPTPARDTDGTPTLVKHSTHTHTHTIRDSPGPPGRRTGRYGSGNVVSKIRLVR